MEKIHVPAVPADAYNPMRPASDLVKTQIRQLQTAIFAAVDTEGEAARCIEVLTGLLQEVRPRLVPTRYGLPKARRRSAAPRRKSSRPKRSSAGSRARKTKTKR